MKSYLLDLPNLAFFETGCNTFESVTSITIDSNMIIDFPQLTTVIIGKDSFIETTSLAFSSKTIYQCSNNRSS